MNVGTMPLMVVLSMGTREIIILFLYRYICMMPSMINFAKKCQSINRVFHLWLGQYPRKLDPDISEENRISFNKEKNKKQPVFFFI